MNDRDDAESAQKTSVLHRIGSFFSMRDDEEELYDDEPEAPRRNVVAFSRETRRSGTEVALFAPALSPTSPRSPTRCARGRSPS